MGKIKDWLVKKQYCKQLQTEGYDAPRIIESPADIIATKTVRFGGLRYYIQR